MALLALPRHDETPQKIELLAKIITEYEPFIELMSLGFKHMNMELPRLKSKRYPRSFLQDCLSQVMFDPHGCTIRKLDYITSAYHNDCKRLYVLGFKKLMDVVKPHISSSTFKEFYQEHYDMEDFTPINISPDLSMSIYAVLCWKAKG